ncbi:MAG: response regulator [Candidatus Krumholzibacteriia bacterium]
MHDPAKILIADDEPHIRRILQFLLEQAGYQVVLAADGRQALEVVARERPDLALLDVMMPQLDGFAVLEQLRKERDSQRLPVIMLTARDESEARVRGLKVGANDYVAKPFDQEELLARVSNLLSAFQAQREANPLTGLPGNHAIEREVTRRLASGVPFAAMYIDIDRFKSFNDHYGYTRGDRAIDLLGQVLCQVTDAVDRESGFVGHIGGDDFVLLCASACADQLATQVIQTFEVGVEHLHDAADWQRGYLETTTRTGEPQQAALITLTIALIGDVHQRYHHPAALSDALAELKRHGKRQPGSVVVKERRSPGAAPELLCLGEQPQDHDA